METTYLERTTELKRNMKELERKLKVSLTLQGRKLVISGDAINEYEASKIIDAINFGFSVQKSLQLLDSEMIFRVLHIRDFTRKKNLEEVRARIIGTNGKTKKTIEDISNCDIIIADSYIGIIGHSESIDGAITAITKIIRGTKQTNAYRYLERRNRTKKEKNYKKSI